MSTGKITERSLFSVRLKSLRGTRNKAEFARFLGVPPPVYQRYEDGRIASGENLLVIANRCGVTVDWLLGRERKEPPDSLPDIGKSEGAVFQSLENAAAKSSNHWKAKEGRAEWPESKRRSELKRLLDQVNEMKSQIEKCLEEK